MLLAYGQSSDQDVTIKLLLAIHLDKQKVERNCVESGLIASS